MNGQPPPACDRDRGCITCSDEGVLLRVMSVQEDGLALCADAEGRRAEVEVDLIDRVAEGDIILVHAGVALVRVGGTEKGLS